jgi:hypothetical protein
MHALILWPINRSTRVFSAFESFVGCWQVEAAPTSKLVRERENLS